GAGLATAGVTAHPVAHHDQMAVRRFEIAGSVLVDLLRGIATGVAELREVDHDAACGSAHARLRLLEPYAELYRAEADQGSVLHRSPRAGRQAVAVDERPVVALFVADHE